MVPLSMPILVVAGWIVQCCFYILLYRKCILKRMYFQTFLLQNLSVLEINLY